MRDDTTSPVVVIDCSRNRIRIHRTALHLLGNPDYVTLLVNPTNLTFAIVPSEKSQISHAVRWERLLSNRCFELYSKPPYSTVMQRLPRLEYVRAIPHDRGIYSGRESHSI